MKALRGEGYIRTAEQFEAIKDAVQFAREGVYTKRFTSKADYLLMKGAFEACVGPAVKFLNKADKETRDAIVLQAIAISGKEPTDSARRGYLIDLMYAIEKGDYFFKKLKSKVR